MPNWDKDSPQLRKNFAQVLKEIALKAELRENSTLEVVRRWQNLCLEGLGMPDAYIGAFRGERDLKNIQVRIVVWPRRGSPTS
jgi:hypothetical protein